MRVVHAGRPPSPPPPPPPPPPPGTELLDDRAADPERVRVNLHDLTRANRWFGGWAAVRFGLQTLAAVLTPGTRLGVLDIGIGAGDLVRYAARWARRRGFQVDALGIEPHAAVAGIARRTGVPVVRACGTALPVRRDGVDVVIVSQVVHHLEKDAAVALLRECDRVASRAVVLADLERTRAARAAFAVGARLLRFDPVTVADGQTSIQRGFTARELVDLLAAAGIRTEVAVRPCCRLVAVWTPEESR